MNFFNYAGIRKNVTALVITELLATISMIQSRARDVCVSMQLAMSLGSYLKPRNGR